MIVSKGGRYMKKGKKTYDYLEFVERFRGDFHDTKKTNEKIDHLGNIIMCMFCYILSKHEPQDYEHFMNDEPKKEV